ncbi:hypothetical protein LTR85_006434 [Meristemomyces frigidus]|nr:hypothetical protein LTR85_006434 [Meristemomyces frigidus]
MNNIPPQQYPQGHFDPAANLAGPAQPQQPQNIYAPPPQGAAADQYPTWQGGDQGTVPSTGPQQPPQQTWQPNAGAANQPWSGGQPGTVLPSDQQPPTQQAWQQPGPVGGYNHPAGMPTAGFPMQAQPQFVAQAGPPATSTESSSEAESGDESGSEKESETTDGEDEADEQEEEDEPDDEEEEEDANPIIHDERAGQPVGIPYTQPEATAPSAAHFYPPPPHFQAWANHQAQQAQAELQEQQRRQQQSQQFMPSPVSRVSTTSRPPSGQQSMAPPVSPLRTTPRPPSAQTNGHDQGSTSRPAVEGRPAGILHEAESTGTIPRPARVHPAPPHIQAWADQQAQKAEQQRLAQERMREAAPPLQKASRPITSHASRPPIDTRHVPMHRQQARQFEQPQAFPPSPPTTQKTSRTTQSRDAHLLVSSEMPSDLQQQPGYAPRYYKAPPRPDPGHQPLERDEQPMLRSPYGQRPGETERGEADAYFDPSQSFGGDGAAAGIRPRPSRLSGSYTDKPTTSTHQPPKTDDLPAMVSDQQTLSIGHQEGANSIKHSIKPGLISTIKATRKLALKDPKYTEDTPERHELLRRWGTFFDHGVVRMSGAAKKKDTAFLRKEMGRVARNLQDAALRETPAVKWTHEESRRSAPFRHTGGRECACKHILRTCTHRGHRKEPHICMRKHGGED